MKTLLTVFIALQVSFLALGQDAVRKKEVGIVFSGFDNFGATFRTGTSKSMWRYSALYLSGNNSNSNNQYFNGVETKSTSFGTQLSFGKEFRKNITEKFQFRYGADLTGGYNTSTENTTSGSISSNSKSKGYNVGINLVAGANYVLAENFLIGLELLPYVRYRNGTTEQSSSFTTPEKGDYSGFNYGLSSSSILLSLVYRW